MVFKVALKVQKTAAGTPAHRFTIKHSRSRLSDAIMKRTAKVNFIFSPHDIMFLGSQLLSFVLVTLTGQLAESQDSQLGEC